MKNEIPFWVRRWIAARYLYARFGKEKDERPFQEQAGELDEPVTEWMPDGEWDEEAKHVSNKDVWGAIRSSVRA